MQNTTHAKLLAEIEAFLAATGMGPSYFGKVSVGNSELVSRLRNGGDILHKTKGKVRKFIRSNTPAGVSSDVSQLDSRVLAGNANGSGHESVQPLTEKRTGDA